METFFLKIYTRFNKSVLFYRYRDLSYTNRKIGELGLNAIFFF